MEPALDVLRRALHGDAGARSFLERTSSIYLLDVTDVSKPKTYGCWNFIHQAMNEVERYEAAYLRSDQAHKMLNGAGLVSHVRLLTSMALRVARRSPASDKKLVMTCIANSERFDGTESQSQWLIDLNLELREIVMGRIAAMAFDFTFHRRVGEQGYSAFADGVVRDTLCAVLSANAVASGPASIRHFFTEWLIPSSKNLPPFALASVILHLAHEGSRLTAPLGSKDILQQLSVHVMSVVLVPILADSVNESSGHEATTAMCLRAMNSWCSASDLSLPQIRHICNKVQIDVVSVVNDAMYSDSPAVVDALAQLVECLVAGAVDNPIPLDRMNQVRHIIQVDESSFQARFSMDQLKVIEQKEMEAIVGEIVSAAGLQRFRFAERQSTGDHDVCRNLARIAASICKVCASDPQNGMAVNPDHGIIELLLKAAGYPIVHVSAIALDGLLGASRRGYASAVALLPILQRRAIIPHVVTKSGTLTLTAYELCGVTYQEFITFRDGVLTEFLHLCWQMDPDNFMDSCAAAVEEFCSAKTLSPELSLQLEAALFCVEAITRLSRSEVANPRSLQLKRIVSSIGSKPAVIFSNPLTLSRTCSLLQPLAGWLAAEGFVAGATGLALDAFRSGLAATAKRDDLVEESGVSVVSCATAAIKDMCFASPGELAHETYVQSLIDTWKESCAPRSASVVLSDRLALCSGVCHVVSSMPLDIQSSCFQSLTSSLLDSVETISAALQVSEGSPTFWSGLSKLSSGVSVMASFPGMTAPSSGLESNSMDIGCDAPTEQVSKIPEAVLEALGRTWPMLRFVCENYSQHQIACSALCDLFSKWLPPPPLVGDSMVLVENILTLASIVARKIPGEVSKNFQPLFLFLRDCIHTYGDMIEKAVTIQNGEAPINLELLRQTKGVVLLTIDCASSTLGTAWSKPKEQVQGQLAFESKPSPLRIESVPNESLAGLLSFTMECLKICPTFLFGLTSGSTPDRGEDLLIRRAIESSVLALNDSDSDVSLSAVTLLRTVVLKATPQQNEIQAFLADALSRSCAEILSRLLLGFCGTMKRELVADAAAFLTIFLQRAAVPDIEAHLGAVLRQDYFLLGDQAKSSMLSVCRRAAHGELSSADVTAFFDAVWELHQVEDREALPNSESVARLVAQFSV